MEKTIKINLGCGGDYKEGWVNVDNDPKCKSDVWSDIETFTQNDNSVDEILLSHVVMYFRPEELRPLLLKWFGWLKLGGKLTIETSDMKEICRIIAESENEEEIYSKGLINVFGQVNSGSHRWGWLPHLLTIESSIAGFQQIYHEKGDKKPNRDFKLIATK